MTPRRLVTVRLVSNGEADDPYLITRVDEAVKQAKSIAAAAGDDDWEVRVDAPEGVEREVDFELTVKAMDAAAAALEERERLARDGAEPLTEEESVNSLVRLYRRCREAFVDFSAKVAAELIKSDEP